MNVKPVSKPRDGALVVSGASLGLVFVAAGAFAQEAKPMVVVPANEARFIPADPARPDGAHVVVLWGDPTRGPSAMLLRFKQVSGSMHVHTSDYHLVVIEGTMKHRARGAPEADATALGPGSYWFQPGGQAHADSCLSTECVMFVNWAGKRDSRLAEDGRSRP